LRKQPKSSTVNIKEDTQNGQNYRYLILPQMTFLELGGWVFEETCQFEYGFYP